MANTLQDINIQKVTNNIKVPNKDWETLKAHFPQYFDKNGKFDFEKFKNYLREKEIAFSTESYGLEWLGKSYARLLACYRATTLLKPDETHNSLPENANAENLLIKGDNLEVLKHLVNAYYEKIKIIYIDPPYNTRNNDFVYQDDRKFTVKELQELAGISEEKAQRILEFIQSKSNSHSAWLTFMYPRLYIARQLLREDGVIFISIDDNEVAQLRILMDEIFGEENFVAEIIRITGSTRNMSVSIDIRHDYVLTYAKNKPMLEIKGLERMHVNEFINPDNDSEGDWSTQDLTVRSGGYEYEIPSIDGRKKFRRKWRFNIDKMKEIMGGSQNQEFSEIYKKNVQKINVNNKDWFVIGKIVFKGESNIPNLKKYLKDVPDITIHSLWNDIESQKIANERLQEIFNDKKIFENPKPVSLLKKLSMISTNDNDLILDFFAGSGTTGDAVMQLNAEDGGNRKFILVQLPEPIDPKKNKAAYDFVKKELKAEPTIFEITKERLLRAAKKIKTETIEKKIAEKQKEIQELESKLDLENKEEKIQQLQSEMESLQKQDLGFKIFETIPIWEDYDFEAKEFDASQTLFDTGKLTEEDIKALLATWKTYDGIPLTQDLDPVDLGEYTAYYGNGKLYLMHKSFTTDHLKTLLNKIDNDRNFEPKSIIAFGYHFESARLRELAENLKTYNNKKKSDIDFIIRY